MKTQILILLLAVNLLSCNRKKEKEEESAYNPFDTSEQLEEYESGSDTIYSRDSVDKRLKSAAKLEIIRNTKN